MPVKAGETELAASLLLHFGLNVGERITVPLVCARGEEESRSKISVATIQLYSSLVCVLHVHI